MSESKRILHAIAASRVSQHLEQSMYACGLMSPLLIADVSASFAQEGLFVAT